MDGSGEGLGSSFYGQADMLLASDLAGLPRSPQLLVGLGAPLPAGNLVTPDLPRLPASVRSPCSTGPGLTQSRVEGVAC